jgi:hypothetical protein
VREIGLLRIAQVADQRPGSGDGLGPRVEAKPLEPADAQLGPQRLTGAHRIERPRLDAGHRNRRRRRQGCGHIDA